MLYTQTEKIMDENRHIYISHFQFEQLILHMLEKLKSVCCHTALMELKVCKIYCSMYTCTYLKQWFELLAIATDDIFIM